MNLVDISECAIENSANILTGKHIDIDYLYSLLRTIKSKTNLNICGFYHNILVFFFCSKRAKLYPESVSKIDSCGEMKPMNIVYCYLQIS